MFDKGEEQQFGGGSDRQSLAICWPEYGLGGVDSEDSGGDGQQS